MKKINLLLEKFILKHYKKIDVNDDIYFYLFNMCKFNMCKMAVLFFILGILLFIFYKLSGIERIFGIPLYSLSKELMSCLLLGLIFSLIIYLFKK